MRLLDQKSMQALFAVTDEIPLDRESVEVPLEMTGEGAVEALPGGRVRITLPDADDLGPFLATVPERVAAAQPESPEG
jgi:hypothetical protein